MGARMRATNHHGRIGTAKHNGRAFDLSRAQHIDPQRGSRNRYWFAGCKTGKYRTMSPTDPEFLEAFQTSELRFYKQRFGKSLKLQNDRYKAQRHPERCRTMEQVLQTKNRQPVETILQIGDCDDEIDPDVFEECVKEYVDRLRVWSDEHHRCYFLINYAIHYDEASPHAHLRGTFSWTDEANVYHMGQDEALKRAGIELPDPNKPRSQYNNRKMAFDRMLREWWIEIAEAHGYEIEKEPIKGVEALPVKAYKRKKDAEKAMERASTQLKVKQQALGGEWQMAQELVAELETLQRQLEQEVKELEDEGSPLAVWAKKRKINREGLTVWDVYQEDMKRQKEQRQSATQKAAARFNERKRDLTGVPDIPTQQQDQGPGLGE